MPIPGIDQPEIIQLTDTYRLRRYDGRYELALAGYRDPVVYENSEGIFDESRIPDLDYVRGSTVYKWNENSLKMHLKLGFKVAGETEKEYYLDLEL